METVFYLSALIALVATFMVITRVDAIHAVLYLIVALLALALVFFLLGAPFAAALEVIIYAGAIMVLFVFVVMMLNLGKEALSQERALLTPGIWLGPSILSAILLIELVVVLVGSEALKRDQAMIGVSAKDVGAALYGPYLLAVELASMLLLGGLVAAYRIGQR